MKLIRLCCLFLPFVIQYTLTVPCKSHSEWTKLVLTHHWPVTVCMLLGHSCTTQPKMNYWTLHGLWPDNGQLCNTSWPFNVTEIKSLLPDMFKFWPDIAHPNGTKFWKHEWEKHGTCAAVDESLNSEYKYFSKALELYRKLDLTSVLMKYNIKPSPSYYQMDDIRKAITSTFGVHAKIQCIPPDEEQIAQTLGQIEICFNQEYELIDCVHEKSTESDSSYFNKKKSSGIYWELNKALSVCDEQLETYYPPISELHR